MITTRSRPFLVFLACLLPLGVLACRIILPPWPEPMPPWPPHRPPPPPAWREMQVKSHAVNIVLDGPRAVVTVTAKFHNPNPQRLEGTYLFPIGRDAAVSSFSMTVNGKTLEAELLPADKARQIYEDIVAKQRDPALLEFAGQGLLKARVFPIEPHAEVVLELSYDQQISRDGRLARFAYPLVAARPGGGQSIEKLKVTVEVRARGPLKTVFTPGYQTKITRPEAGRALIEYEAGEAVPERDFEVVYSEQGGPVGLEFLSFRKGDEGYFMLAMQPASELQAEQVAAKDLLLVVDTSGSMSGDKMRQAREALKFCLNNLGPKDYFNIIAFSTEVLPMAGEALPATDENRRKGLEFVESLAARGGTAIDDALAAALASKRAADTVRMTVFLTDGLPTIGEVGIPAILKRVTGAEGAGRLFTFGVGYDVNTVLLDGLARQARGYASYVRPQEDLELALSSFYGRIAHPVLTGVTLVAEGATLRELNPVNLPDLFKDSPVFITGRYSGTGQAKLKLSGELKGKRETFTCQADLAGDARNAFIPRLWATARVAYLEEQIKLRGTNNELVDEVRRLGREYGIITPYTSFLIVEEGLRPEQRAEVRRKVEMLDAQARGADSGKMAFEQSARNSGMAADAMAPAAPPAAGSSVGGGVTHYAEIASEAAGIAPAKLRELVLYAADKTFYLRQEDGYLWDSAIPAGTTPKVDLDLKAWSPEFIALLRDQPSLRAYLRVGLNLVLKLDQRIIRISEK